MGERKSIFITGAGSGIGRAAAQLFAERGWFVGLFDVNQEGLDETAALLPEGQQISMTFDVRDRAGWAHAVEAFAQVTNRQMQVLFNNAGIARSGSFEDISQDDADLVIDVNVKGVMNGVHAALPLLRETPGSSIINTSSVAGLVGWPRGASYTASKFAVRGLTEALDLEFERYGIRVAALMPWFVETPLLDVATPEPNRTMRDGLNERKIHIYPSRDVAERAWEAAHGDKRLYPVGKEAHRLRFFAHFFPNALRRQMRNLMMRKT